MVVVSLKVRHLPTPTPVASGEESGVGVPGGGACPGDTPTATPASRDDALPIACREAGWGLRAVFQGSGFRRRLIRAKAFDPSTHAGGIGTQCPHHLHNLSVTLGPTTNPAR